MKRIEECKEYFKDVFANMIAENAADKSIFESTEKAQFEMLENLLKFVYGEEFSSVCEVWKNQALNEYYKEIYNQTAEKS